MDPSRPGEEMVRDGTAHEAPAGLDGDSGLGVTTAWTMSEPFPSVDQFTTACLLPGVADTDVTVGVMSSGGIGSIGSLTDSEGDWSLFALKDGKVLFDKNSKRVNIVAEAAAATN